MKFLVLLMAVVLLVVYGCSDLQANYEYQSHIGSFWDLSVKASTLDVKADYLDKFVVAIEAADLHGNDAIIFPTPNNSVEQNIAALQSLQHRMHEIRAMDPTSFQYQTAMQQITAQEQDEAHDMLGVLEGRWYLSHHLFLWGWISGLCYVALIVVVCVAGLVAFGDLV